MTNAKKENKQSTQEYKQHPVLGICIQGKCDVVLHEEKKEVHSCPSCGWPMPADVYCSNCR